MAVQERLGGLCRWSLPNRPSRSSHRCGAGPAPSSAPWPLHPADDHPGFAKVARCRPNTREGVAWRVGQGDEHLLGPPPALPHIVLDYGVLTVEPVLVTVMRDMPNSRAIARRERPSTLGPLHCFPTGSLTRRRRSGWLSLRVDGFTLAIRGQSPCGESPADRGHRSQSFSLVTTDPVGVHACSEVLHGDAAKTSSGRSESGGHQDAVALPG